MQMRLKACLRHYGAGVAVAGAALVAAGIGTAVAVEPEAGTTAPPDDTIVSIIGDRANGFGIEYYDGSAIYPPTGSEARAECGEYDQRRDRVRCRTEVRTWYRDLTDFKVALDWAHAS
jgi:hypothetical protein